MDGREKIDLKERERGWVFRAGGGLTKRGARTPLSSVTLIFIF